MSTQELVLNSCACLTQASLLLAPPPSPSAQAGARSPMPGTLTESTETQLHLSAAQSQVRSQGAASFSEWAEHFQPTDPCPGWHGQPHGNYTVDAFLLCNSSLSEVATGPLPGERGCLPLCKSQPSRVFPSRDCYRTGDEIAPARTRAGERWRVEAMGSRSSPVQQSVGAMQTGKTGTELTVAGGMQANAKRLQGATQ